MEVSRGFEWYVFRFHFYCFLVWPLQVTVVDVSAFILVVSWILECHLNSILTSLLFYNGCSTFFYVIIFNKKSHLKSWNKLCRKMKLGNDEVWNKTTERQKPSCKYTVMKLKICPAKLKLFELDTNFLLFFFFFYFWLSYCKRCFTLLQSIWSQDISQKLFFDLRH